MGTKTKTQNTAGETAVIVPAGYLELHTFSLGSILVIDESIFGTIGPKMAAAFQANPKAVSAVFQADRKGNIKTKQVQTLTLIGGELIANGAIRIVNADGTMEEFRGFSDKHGAAYCASFERPVDAAGVGRHVARLAIETAIANKATR